MSAVISPNTVGTDLRNKPRNLLLIHGNEPRREVCRPFMMRTSKDTRWAEVVVWARLFLKSVTKDESRGKQYPQGIAKRVMGKSEDLKNTDFYLCVTGAESRLKIDEPVNSVLWLLKFFIYIEERLQILQPLSPYMQVMLEYCKFKNAKRCYSSCKKRLITWSRGDSLTAYWSHLRIWEIYIKAVANIPLSYC